VEGSTHCVYLPRRFASKASKDIEDISISLEVKKIRKKTYLLTV